jgi:alpha-1,2-mannosyltransferase
MYSNIQDCDEGKSHGNFDYFVEQDITSVFNFWEPLHYIDHGHGFQTWEVTPMYAIRSWAYVLLHLVPARLLLALSLGKVSLGDTIVLATTLTYPCSDLRSSQSA